MKKTVRGSHGRVTSTVKRITTLFLFAVLLILPVERTYAEEAPNPVYLKRVLITSGLVDNAPQGFTEYATEDGRTIFSLNLATVPPTTGQRLKLLDDCDVGLQWLVLNGYPEKEITGNDEIDFYITQAAIWWYHEGKDKLATSFTNPGSNDIYKLVPTYIEPMVEQAKSVELDSRSLYDMQVSASVEIANEQHNDLVSYQDPDGREYLISEVFTPAVSGSDKFTVSNPESDGAFIVDASGNRRTEFLSGESFRVLVPMEAAYPTQRFVVSISCNAIVPTARIYRYSEPDEKEDVNNMLDETSERMVCLVNEDVEVKRDIELIADKALSESATTVVDIVISVVAGLAVVALVVAFSIAIRSKG